MKTGQDKLQRDAQAQAKAVEIVKPHHERFVGAAKAKIRSLEKDGFEVCGLALLKGDKYCLISDFGLVLWPLREDQRQAQRNRIVDDHVPAAVAAIMALPCDDLQCDAVTKILQGLIART